MLVKIREGLSEAQDFLSRSGKTVFNALFCIILISIQSSAYSRSWREALKDFGGKPSAAHSVGSYGTGMYVLGGITGKVTEDILYDYGHSVSDSSSFRTFRNSISGGFVFDVKYKSWIPLGNWRSKNGYGGRIDFLPNGDLYCLDEVNPYWAFKNDPDPFSGSDSSLITPGYIISRFTSAEGWSYSNSLDRRYGLPFKSNRFDDSNSKSFLQLDGSVLTLVDLEGLSETILYKHIPLKGWEKLNTANNPGTERANLGFQGVQIENKITIWGGKKRCGTIIPDCPPPEFDTKVHTLDLTTMSWSERDLPGAPLGRVETKAFRYQDNKIVFFGGYGQFKPYFDGGILDTVNMKWLPIPSPTADSGIQFESLMHYSVNLWKNKLIVWGGSLPDNLTATGAILDLDLMTWSKMPDANIAARALHSGSVIDDKLIIWGGSGEGFNALGDGGVYDLKLNQWLD